MKFNDAQRLTGLVELVGHYQDGTGTVVSLFDDDATRTYHVKVGGNYLRSKRYDGESIREALDKAISDNPDALTQAMSCAAGQPPYADPDGLRFRTMFAAARLVSQDRDGTDAAEINARLNAIMVEDEDGEHVADIDALRQVLDGLIRDKLVEVE